MTVTALVVSLALAQSGAGSPPTLPEADARLDAVEQSQRALEDRLRALEQALREQGPRAAEAAERVQTLEQQFDAQNEEREARRVAYRDALSDLETLLMDLEMLQTAIFEGESDVGEPLGQSDARVDQVANAVARVLGPAGVPELEDARGFLASAMEATERRDLAVAQRAVFGARVSLAEARLELITAAPRSE